MPPRRVLLAGSDGAKWRLPCGTAVYLHGWAMGQDPALWDEDPLAFIPERWFNARNKGLDVHGKVARKNVEHYKFVPFSAGPRTCPGYSFAKVAVFLQVRHREGGRRGVAV